MKSAISSIAFGALASSALANPNYVNTVRQVQQDTGVEWDVTVSSLGEMISPEGVGLLGSNFELWTLNSETGDSTFLDSQFVSAFTPSGEVQIVTGDPYPDAPRTRVDMPFTVTLTVDGLVTETVMTASGLTNSSEVPLSGRQVDFEHRLLNFPEGGHSADRNLEDAALYRSLPYTENGSYVDEFEQSNLTGDILPEVEGLEIFSLYSVADGQMPSELLDEKVLTVWPMAKAEIVGLGDDPEMASIPPLTIELTDLYPDSTTYIRIYQGEQTAQPDNPIEINKADLVINDVVPQDRSLSLTDLGEMMGGEGVWTIEVVHVTPWGPESLTHERLDLSRSITVRAGLFSK